MIRKSIRRTMLFLSITAFNSACSGDESLRGYADRLVFTWSGVTLFANPVVVSFKEVHLDNGSLAGRQVIVEGAVQEIGRLNTYAVLTDDTARMLVVFTEMPDPAKLKETQITNHIRILGTIENGKKGMPFVSARALSFKLAAKKS